VKLPQRLLSLSSLLLLSIGLIAQSVPSQRLIVPQEPTPNLGQLKTRLIAYHDCLQPRRCYLPELNRQSKLAIAYLQRRAAKAAPGEKLAIVLDIDETALSNWEEETQDDFGFIPNDWNIWVEKKQATPNAGTLRLFNEAMKHKVAVFFITGRSTAQEPATVENLNAAGYRDWAGLSMRGPHPFGQTTREYKSGERRKIVEAGYRIILNVGDQMSDLTGSPRAELSVKLPNPFYYIP